MSKMIDILVVEPGKAPRPARVENTLEKITEIVGGQPEMGCFLPQRVLLACREDMTGLTPNRRNPTTGEVISGPFLLCGFDDTGFSSLTPEQQQEFGRSFARPGEFMLVGADTVCATLNELLLASYKLWDNLRDGETVLLTKWGGSGKGAAE